MTVGYQGVVNAQTGLPFNLGNIIVLYAQDIAGRQGHPVTLETMTAAYQFFLVDLQRYLAGIGVKFQDTEELVDWKVVTRADNQANTLFLLITNQRVIKAIGNKILKEMRFLEGETGPVIVFSRESSPGSLFSALTFVLRTNKRLIWYMEKFGNKDTFAVGDLDPDAGMEDTAYFDKSKLLLMLTDRQLLIWPEEKPLQTIPLANIARVETAVEIVEKKTLLISHKVEQNKVVLYCPNKLEININARDQETVKEFCARE
jgi:hypothetical protein